MMVVVRAKRRSDIGAVMDLEADVEGRSLLEDGDAERKDEEEMEFCWRRRGE